MSSYKDWILKMDELAESKAKSSEEKTSEVKKVENKVDKRAVSIEKVRGYLQEKYVIAGSVKLEEYDDGNLKLVDEEDSSVIADFFFDSMGNFEIKHRNKNIVTTKTSFSFLADNSYFVARNKEKEIDTKKELVK